MARNSVVHDCTFFTIEKLQDSKFYWAYFKHEISENILKKFRIFPNIFLEIERDQNRTTIFFSRPDRDISVPLDYNLFGGRSFEEKFHSTSDGLLKNDLAPFFRGLFNFKFKHGLQ